MGKVAPGSDGLFVEGEEYGQGMFYTGLAASAKARQIKLKPVHKSATPVERGIKLPRSTGFAKAPAPVPLIWHPVAAMIWRV